ncbi:signal peptidase II [Woeseiaceae bacterium]|jgi:signal peptidase II|nr:signal peptidase II [Woeseiaceae bacterium]MDB2543764.1 signal peptidase II [Woeseiaceae bacterium]|tara:strand:+ start:936 stop:1439 length:504 start_codon:yes stop_codon:yes gene_type:complete
MNKKNLTSETRLLLKWSSVTTLIVILDQWVKYWIVLNLSLYEKIGVNFFINITYQQNTGAAFSILADAGGWQRWFLSILAILVCGYIVHWLYQLRTTSQWYLSYGLSFVLGGALGNVIDRIRLGYVVDYAQVLINGWPFPSFNVADAAITIGAVLIIIDAIINKELY